MPRFTPEFLHSIEFMLVGMISIFIVIGVVIISTVILNKFFSKDDKN